MTAIIRTHVARHELRAILRHVGAARGRKDPSRLHLARVHADGVCVAATDGHRVHALRANPFQLARGERLDLDDATIGYLQAAIAGDFGAEWITVTPAADGWALAPVNTTAACGSEVLARWVLGDFPPYAQVLIEPGTGIAQVRAPADEVVRALREINRLPGRRTTADVVVRGPRVYLDARPVQVDLEGVTAAGEGTVAVDLGYLRDAVAAAAWGGPRDRPREIVLEVPPYPETADGGLVVTRGPLRVAGGDVECGIMPRQAPRRRAFGGSGDQSS